MPTPTGNNMAKLLETVRSAENYTIINTDGVVVHQGSGGVVIIDGDKMPILEISEISDDQVTNLFLQPIGEGSGIFASDDYPSPDYKTWEILRNRKPQEEKPAPMTFDAKAIDWNELQTGKDTLKYMVRMAELDNKETPYWAKSLLETIAVLEQHRPGNRPYRFHFSGPQGGYIVYVRHETFQGAQLTAIAKLNASHPNVKTKKQSCTLSDEYREEVVTLNPDCPHLKGFVFTFTTKHRHLDKTYTQYGVGVDEDAAYADAWKKVQNKHGIKAAPVYVQHTAEMIFTPEHSIHDPL